MKIPKSENRTIIDPTEVRGGFFFLLLLITYAQQATKALTSAYLVFSGFFLARIYKKIETKLRLPYTLYQLVTNQPNIKKKRKQESEKAKNYEHDAINQRQGYWVSPLLSLHFLSVKSTSTSTSPPSSASPFFEKYGGCWERERLVSCSPGGEGIVVYMI